MAVLLVIDDLHTSQVSREIRVLRRVCLRGCVCYLSVETMSEGLMIVALSPADPMNKAGCLTTALRAVHATHDSILLILVWRQSRRRGEH